MVTSMAQIYIANQTPNDPEFVLLLPFEGLLLVSIIFISPYIMAVLAMMSRHCRYPCVPLSIQPPTEKVIHHPLPRDGMWFVSFGLVEFLYSVRRHQINSSGALTLA